jgi:sterol desaturase/sphingolipid hydroxylase (fatty acid hydroxylase superfamily)
MGASCAGIDSEVEFLLPVKPHRIDRAVCGPYAGSAVAIATQGVRMETEDQGVRSDSAFMTAKLAAIPANYSPILHLCASVGIGLAFLTVGIVFIGSFGWAEFATVIAVIVISNLVEWWAHRDLLHRRRRFWEVLYDQHTPSHHRIYRYGSMSVASRREWHYVLMPAKGVFGITILAVPLALAIGFVFGADPGWTSLMTSSLYATAYELTHLSYHLPSGHPVQRLRIIRWMSRHHARHHDPRLMQKWNFNVTVPLWDFLLGTNFWGRKAKEP